MRMIKLILPFFLLFFFLFAVNVNAVEVNLTPISDSYVVKWTDNKLNYGQMNQIRIGNDSYSSWRGFLLFDLSSINPGAIIDSATLHLYVYYSHGSWNVSAYNTTPYNTTGTSFWNEGSLSGQSCGSGANCNLDHNITYANQPASDIFQSNWTSTGGNWGFFNITDSVQSSVNTTNATSILLKLSDESLTWYQVDFDSSENTDNKPYLNITYHLTDCVVSCGVCGCTQDMTGCLEHTINGTWCDDYNLTPMCTDYVLTGCWDPYTEELPNPFNASKNTFTTFKADSTTCGIVSNSCPSGYMCGQGVYWNNQIPADSPQPSYPFPIYTTSLGKNWTWRGAIVCHSDQSLTDYYFNENGEQVNFSDIYFPNNTLFSCENPELYNNSWTCIVSNCHWCSSTLTCRASISECPNACLNASQFNNPVDCNAGHCNWCNDACQSATCPTPTADSLTALSSWINNSFGTSFATSLISFITSACISMYIFINVKEKKMETFIVPFLLILGGFSYITFFPLWLLLLMTIMTGVLIFWKARG